VVLAPRNGPWAGDASIFVREVVIMATNLPWLPDLVGLANRFRRRQAKRGRKPRDRNRAVLGVTWLEDRCTPSYLVTDLGPLPGDYSSAAFGINATGQVVGASRNASGFSRAVLWTNGTPTDLGAQRGDSPSVAYAINAQGQVVVDSLGSPSVPPLAFLWASGSMTELPPLPGTATSAAYGINDQGQVVGESTGHAVLWTNGTPTDLGTWPIDSTSVASAINAQGQVVGASGPSGARHAVLWAGDSMINLPLLSAPRSEDSAAYAINAQGQVVGETSSFAVLWANGNATNLGTLDDDIISVAYGINAQGQVVGGSRGGPSGTEHAVLWADGGVTDLNTLLVSGSGITLLEARAINDSGQIVCDGVVAGVQHAFLLTPPSAVGDLVWEDLNRNGIQDAGEPGLAGATVQLLDSNNRAVDSRITDATGSYLFDDLAPGTYTVTVTPPPGYVPTVTGQGIDPSADSNPSPSSITLAPGQLDMTIDFGFSKQVQPPTADPGGPYFGVEGTPVLLDGTGSSDPNGYPLTYTWDFDDGTPPSTDVRTSHVYKDEGAYHAVLTVDDGLGGVDSARVDVLVADAPPVLAVPANLTVEATGPDGAVVTLPRATATDYDDNPVTIAYDAPAQGPFALGETAITVIATNAHLTRTTGTFTVTVRDTTPPAITVPPDITAEATGPAGAVVNFTTSASDLVDGTVPATASPTSGATFPRGATPVTVTATDAHGNRSARAFIVTVADTTPPTLAAAAPVLVGTDPGASYATGVVLGMPVVSDKVGPVSVVNDAPAVFPVGTTTVTWTATDEAGNRTTATQTVTVVDREPPTVTAPADITQSTDPGKETATIDPGLATATDNVRVASLVWSRSDGARNLTDPFPVGTTIITWMATDEAGNTATATQRVTVTIVLTSQTRSYTYADAQGQSVTVQLEWGGSATLTLQGVPGGAGRMQLTSLVVAGASNGTDLSVLVPGGVTTIGSVTIAGTGMHDVNLAAVTVGGFSSSVPLHDLTVGDVQRTFQATAGGHDVTLGKILGPVTLGGGFHDVAVGNISGSFTLLGDAHDLTFGKVLTGACVYLGTSAQAARIHDFTGGDIQGGLFVYDTFHDGTVGTISGRVFLQSIGHQFTTTSRARSSGWIGNDLTLLDGGDILLGTPGDRPKVKTQK
jgi:probable HAF family extracellular repeat protein